MLIVQAEHMGMCFGVEDALEAAESVNRPEAVTILGEIVHNRGVQEGLLARGYASQPENARAALPETPGVLITAHGISKLYRQRLETAGKQIVDTTCPLVTRLHKTAEKLVTAGYRLVLAGKPGHVEVLGITEDFPDTVVVADAAAVRTGLGQRLAVVAQTTTPSELFAQVAARVRELHPTSEIRVSDTICRPTRQRQAAIGALLGRVQALVVVGGANSNNTQRLVDQARQRGLPCWRVERDDELQPHWFADLAVVGLTAGTSTPRSTVQAVHRRLLSIGRTLRRAM
jgi:4-hydroxy-3-methylbut-2-en-1-yl diphosphate reductase